LLLGEVQSEYVRERWKDWSGKEGLNDQRYGFKEGDDDGHK